MSKRMIAAVLLAMVASLAFVPAATAGPSAAAPQAQATPGAESTCGIGELCEVENPGEIQEGTSGKVNDPPGATIRSLVMLSFMAVGFVFYLSWALGRSSALQR